MSNSHVLAARASAMLETAKGKDIEKRLSLYQVFLKLYEQNPSLLEEILSLENSEHQSLVGSIPQYIQGVACQGETYLITNLLGGRSQALRQPQYIWPIGRDRHAAIPINDLRLSRRHAVIQYIDGRGFYLIDMNSSNGSFVNGEPIKHRHRLKDGDRVRLGSIAFVFFICQNSHLLEAVSPEMRASVDDPDLSLETDLEEDTTVIPAPQPAVGPLAQEETSMFLRSSPAASNAKLSPMSGAKLNSARQSLILDRLLNKQKPSSSP